MLTELEKYNLVLPSNPEEIAKVEPLVDGLREEFQLNDEIYANLMISLTEAVNNGIIHGNKEDVSKKVEVKVSQDNNQLCITVKDQGPGFDYNNLPDPTAPENLEKLSGRGVFLMTQLADLVIFSDNGATVEIFFKT